MMRYGKLPGLAGLVAAALALAPAGAAAQGDTSPLHGFVISGYGTTNYAAVMSDNASNDFNASLSPIILYTLSEDLLFEAEFEFELEDGGGTETAVEYAQIDFLGFESFQVTAGKFLLPFGLFSERLHPTWINKLPSMPLLYGHAHGGVAEGALLPVLSDVGLMARYNAGLGTSSTLDLAFWVTQGPEISVAEEGGELAADGHAHALAPRLSVAGAGAAGAAAQPIGDVPSVAFGNNFNDNNDNKMLGARLGFVQGGGFEVYASGFHAMYDEGDFLDIYGANFSAEWRKSQLELRGEAAVLWQEFGTETAYETLRSPGYYVQASRRFGAFEPVVRWSQLLDPEIAGTAVDTGARQFAFGLDYWLRPSIPIKAAFEVNVGGDERLLFQWAYGF